MNGSDFVFDKEKDYLYVKDEDEVRESFENNIRDMYNKLEENDRKHCIRNKDFMKKYRESIMEVIRLPVSDKIVINDMDVNIVGAVRYKDCYFYISFSSYYSDNCYLSWVLNEEIVPVEEDDLLDLSKRFD